MPLKFSLDKDPGEGEEQGYWCFKPKEEKWRLWSANSPAPLPHGPSLDGLVPVNLPCAWTQYGFVTGKKAWEEKCQMYSKGVTLMHKERSREVRYVGQGVTRSIAETLKELKNEGQSSLSSLP